MNAYTSKETTDIFFMYGRAKCNGHMAAGLYREQFPDRRQLNHKTFAVVDRRLRKSGIFKTVSMGWGTQRAVQTHDVS
jgi:hypothetical protein